MRGSDLGQGSPGGLMALNTDLNWYFGNSIPTAGTLICRFTESDVADYPLALEVTLSLLFSKTYLKLHMR